MVEDDVKNDAQPGRVGIGYQRHQFGAATKARVDVEEVLHAVAVIAVEMTALLENRTQPQAGHAELLQIGELG